MHASSCTSEKSSLARYNNYIKQFIPQDGLTLSLQKKIAQQGKFYNNYTSIILNELVNTLLTVY